MKIEEPEIVFQSSYKGRFLESVRIGNLGEIYFVDKVERNIIRIFGSQTDVVPVRFSPTSINPLSSGTCLITSNNSVYSYSFLSCKFECLIESSDLNKGESFNDSLFHSGVLYISSMDVEERSNKGSLYEFCNNRIRKLLKNFLVVGNGLIIRGRRLFVSDSGTNVIYEYDKEPGHLALRRQIDLDGIIKGPDGIARGLGDTILIPSFFDGDVFAFDVASGVIAKRYQLPVQHATSVTLSNIRVDGIPRCRMLIATAVGSATTSQYSGRLLGIDYE